MRPVEGREGEMAHPMIPRPVLPSLHSIPWNNRRSPWELLLTLQAKNTSRSSKITPH
ncbi:hypothetical protein PRIPAC_95399 [Pristionchus pacificus]|uniref:Uncharacterized protein n=1 Tax=Pristionchus pacificus TaxID=54126 RepID=A0A2A6D0Q1_PRIPA|nr:hypothetical protein PRIPAC_95399 [Pristionchus pacificus]|eukprot:PDM83985.1 hypothetical protein PRIPAC_34177 [Pristionchus pacificus]